MWEREGKSSQAGVLGWGVVVPVTEPSRGLCTGATPTKCRLDGRAHEHLEERRVRVPGHWAMWMVNTVG